MALSVESRLSLEPSYVGEKPHKALDVVAVGDINLDIITSPIVSLPERETSFTVDSMGLYTGGNAANFAGAAASLGMRTAFIGALGEDPISEWLRAAMTRYGVRLAVKTRRESTAGITFAVTYTDGTRQFIATHGSNLDLSYTDIDLSLAGSARHLHRSGFWYCPQLIGEPTRRLLRAAREGGVQTSLDIGWDNQGWTDERVSHVNRTLGEVDIFFVNERELQRLTREERIEEALDRVLATGVGMVALHLGERGSMVVTRGERIAAPAFKVKPTLRLRFTSVE
ncbi:MAG: PfkB family carbohydrate kinase [Candidatus Bathyarchaeia archaeon]